MSKKPKPKNCVNADKNPSCPYIAQIQQITTQSVATNAAVAASTIATNTAMTYINQQGEDLKAIKKALVGDDMQGGLVEKVAKLNTMYKILVFVGGTCVATFIGIMVKVVFNV